MSKSEFHPQLMYCIWQKVRRSNPQINSHHPQNRHMAAVAQQRRFLPFALFILEVASVLLKGVSFQS